MKSISLSIAYPPLYAPFTYAHKTISRSSKSKPPENSRMFHLSLAIYATTIIVFEAKARYVHWTSESTHYGHHLSLVVVGVKTGGSRVGGPELCV